MPLQLTSLAFGQGEKIPSKFTGDGADVSPPLAWPVAPFGTRSFTLICDDPDAPRGTWVHWVLFNMSSDQQALDEGVPTTEKLANGALQGTNDFGKIGYGGPAPPPGKPHRYFFKLYALDAVLPLPAGSTKSQLVNAMKGHVIDEGELMGTYQR